jgi:hypothetical protein
MDRLLPTRPNGELGWIPTTDRFKRSIDMKEWNNIQCLLCLSVCFRTAKSGCRSGCRSCGGLGEGYFLSSRFSFLQEANNYVFDGFDAWHLIWKSKFHVTVQWWDIRSDDDPID